MTQPIKGELRTRDMEIIAGENSTETIHKEFGLRFKIDVKKAYFSPRLATERKHVTELVKEGETVLEISSGSLRTSGMIEIPVEFEEARIVVIIQPHIEENL